MLRAGQIFRRRTDPTRAQLGRLVVKGGSVTVTKHLEETLGITWDGMVAVPVFTLATEDGSIKGARWMLLGGLESKGLTCKAKNIWETAEDDLYLQMRIKDAAMFQFPSKGTNSSFWLDSTEVDYKIIDKNKKVLEKEEAEEKGISGFSVRAVVHPEGPHTVNLWIGVVPVSKDKLKEMNQGGMNKAGCPQIHLMLGGGTTRNKIVDMLVKDTEGLGLATMALLEWLSQEEPILPTVKDYRESIHEFMRKAKMPNNKSSRSILAALEDPAE